MEDLALTIIKSNSDKCLKCQFFDKDCSFKSKVIARGDKKIKGKIIYIVKNCAKRDF